MVGGTVYSIFPLEERIWVNCVDRTYSRPQYCAVYVERCEEAERIRPGDKFWWQGGTGFWTPQDESREDVRINLVGYSGVSHPISYVRDAYRASRAIDAAGRLEPGLSEALELIFQAAMDREKIAEWVEKEWPELLSEHNRPLSDTIIILLKQIRERNLAEATFGRHGIGQWLKDAFFEKKR